MASDTYDLTVKVTLDISPEDRETVATLKWLRELAEKGQSIPVSLLQTPEKPRYRKPSILTDEEVERIWTGKLSGDNGPFHYTATSDGDVVDHKSKPAWENK